MGRILGIDYGEKRIGIAMCDPLQRLSSALCTINNTALKKSLGEIVNICSNQQVVAVIVGMPVNMDGSRGEKAEWIDQFIVKIQNRLPKTPVLPWDERWSTKSAENILHESGKSPSKHRHLIDQIAAEIILQSFLDRLDFMKRAETGQH